MMFHDKILLYIYLIYKLRYSSIDCITTLPFFSFAIIIATFAIRCTLDDRALN